ncbi:DUF1465 family protein [Sphingomonas morindae]|uniref:DUF1465 family protein n=1 Tax=Sphingomonas morindae TaxID=1541170 RepID=A0ABY4X698_9SPHN|nr:DUF1465 family protein [Sphingomonas morindae]USI72406.1 DUF1465 family protein [Sphingomonas morindae]
MASGMPQAFSDPVVAPLIDALYTEAMLLADEARGYFEYEGRLDRDALAPRDRIAFSCESLRVTTRLMHVIAWLLGRRAVLAGELEAARASEGEWRLGLVTNALEDHGARLPEGARRIIDASIDLHARAARLDTQFAEAEAGGLSGPANALLDRLRQIY